MTKQISPADEITEVCKACHGTKNAGSGGYCDVCQDWGTVRPEVNAAFLAGKSTRNVEVTPPKKDEPTPPKKVEPAPPKK